MERYIRDLAKSSKYQFLYARAKEIDGIQFFKNTSDFTKLQIQFLQWLEIYHMLYMDLAMEEDYISQEVIDDDLRADAYLLFRSKKKKQKHSDKNRKPTTGSHPSGIPSVIFKGKRG